MCEKAEWVSRAITGALVAVPLLAGAADLFIEPRTGTELGVIEGGSYRRGDWTGNGRGNERPSHRTEVNGFCLGTTEVTVAQFRRFSEATGYRTAAEVRGWVLDIGADMAAWERRAGINWRSPGFPTSDEHPVVWVDWRDAAAYAAWLAERSGLPFRLPYEAEWEYAARSGGRNERWAGTVEADPLRRFAWYEPNSGGVPHAVGRKKPNGLGLFDMSGNVWEWCADDLAPYPASRGPSFEPGTTLFRALRGGSWRVAAELVTTTYRSAYRTDYAHSSIGFRVALGEHP